MLQVGLLKGHVQLKELSISPFGGVRLERSSLSLSTRVVGALDVSKTCSPGFGRGAHVEVVKRACINILGSALRKEWKIQIFG